jgi:hypothetical protein
MGAPRVVPATWPEAARRYLAAAATANYLSMAPGRPPSLVRRIQNMILCFKARLILPDVNLYYDGLK